VSPWRLWRPGVGCKQLRKDFDCRFSNSGGVRLDGRIRWGTQMRLSGELACDLMFLLFAGTARSCISVTTDEI
jgi:hypothetical protein